MIVGLSVNGYSCDAHELFNSMSNSPLDCGSYVLRTGLHSYSIS
jgi:hypothetical protein